MLIDDVPDDEPLITYFNSEYDRSCWETGYIEAFEAEDPSAQLNSIYLPEDLQAMDWTGRERLKDRIQAEYK